MDGISSIIEKRQATIDRTGDSDLFSRRNLRNIDRSIAHSGQHAKCIEQFKAVVKAQSAEWKITGSDIPLKIDDAINRIQSKK